jgi:hypothetical protein
MHSSYLGMLAAANVVLRVCESVRIPFRLVDVGTFQKAQMTSVKENSKIN